MYHWFCQVFPPSNERISNSRFHWSFLVVKVGCIFTRICFSNKILSLQVAHCPYIANCGKLADFCYLLYRKKKSKYKLGKALLHTVWQAWYDWSVGKMNCCDELPCSLLMTEYERFQHKILSSRIQQFPILIAERCNILFGSFLVT